MGLYCNNRIFKKYSPYLMFQTNEEVRHNFWPLIDLISRST